MLGFEKIPNSRSLPLEVLFCLELIKIQKYRFEALTFRK